MQTAHSPRSSRQSPKTDLSELKIQGYETHVVQTPWRTITTLVLRTEDGFEGYGESRVVGKTHTVIEFLREKPHHFIGQSALNRGEIHRNFTRKDFGAPGEVTMTALALVDMACWDLFGKRAGLPVYKCIGGGFEHRQKIPAYANGWYQGPRTPRSFAAAVEKVAERGYKALKFDPFGNGDLMLSPAEERLSLKIIGAVYRAAAKYDMQILIEMHGRFAPVQALRIAAQIEQYKDRIGWLEEPTLPDDLPALATVRKHTNLPLATGERLYSAKQYARLFDMEGVVDFIQPDITQCGGLSEVLKIADTACLKSIMVAPHNVGGIISTLAGLHLMAAIPNGYILEHFNDFTDKFVKRTGSPYPEVDKQGNFALPTGPGWGVQLNYDFLKSRAAKRVNGVIMDLGLNMFHSATWHQRDGSGALPPPPRK